MDIENYDWISKSEELGDALHEKVTIEQKNVNSFQHHISLISSALEKELEKCRKNITYNI
jgi:hypothetical protein